MFWGLVCLFFFDYLILHLEHPGASQCGGYLPCWVALPQPIWSLCCKPWQDISYRCERRLKIQFQFQKWFIWSFQIYVNKYQRKDQHTLLGVSYNTSSCPFGQQCDWHQLYHCMWIHNNWWLSETLDSFISSLMLIGSIIYVPPLRG